MRVPSAGRKRRVSSSVDQITCPTFSRCAPSAMASACFSSRSGDMLLPEIGDREGRIGTVQGGLDARRVVEIGLEHFGAQLSEFPGGRAVGLAGDGADPVIRLVPRQHGARQASALRSRGAEDREEREVLCHANLRVAPALSLRVA